MMLSLYDQIINNTALPEWNQRYNCAVITAKGEREIREDNSEKGGRKGQGEIWRRGGRE